MQIYHYHPATGVLLYASDADQSPLEENVFLIPAHATDIAPPALKTDQVAAFIDGTWELLTDWTAKPLWLLDGTQYQIGQAAEVGQFFGYGDLPSWLVAVEPPPSLDRAKASQLAIIATAFTAASTAPMTDSAGLTWNGGFESAQAIYGATQLAAAGGATSVTIFDANNIGHELTIAQATAVAAEVGASYQTAFAKYQGLKVAIAAATTVAAVQAISW